MNRKTIHRRDRVAILPGLVIAMALTAACAHEESQEQAQKQDHEHGHHQPGQAKAPPAVELNQQQRERDSEELRRNIDATNDLLNRTRSGDEPRDQAAPSSTSDRK